EVPRSNGRLIAKRWLAVSAVPVLAAFGYLYVSLWFAAHQREFQYTTGGSRVTPEAVGLDGFTAVEIQTEDDERIAAWWGPPFPGGGAVLILPCTPSPPSHTIHPPAPTPIYHTRHNIH